MTSSTWSLEGELCKLANEPDPRNALVRLGLIGVGIGGYQLDEIQPWVRSGNETYSYVFAVRAPGTPDRICRFKACVAPPGPHGLDKILGRWLRRRDLLSKMGVSTPTLYGAGQGVLLEEEIPFDIPTAVRHRETDAVLNGLIDIASALATLGFSPVSPFSDVRSRGNDAVFVDFGSDLGEPSVAPKGSNAIFNQLLEQLNRWNVELCANDFQHLESAYKDRLNS